MIQWVAELSARVVGKQNVYIATDDNRIQNTVTQLGYNVVMTSEKLSHGTDRLAEVAKKIEADIYINVQGDEPLVNPKDIQKVIDCKKQYPNDVINGYTTMRDDEDPQSLNKPKIIFTEDKRMVYISRQAVPGFKEPKHSSKVFHKQVCIYAFNREELLEFGNFGRKSKLEESEDIEIIRFLEWEKISVLLKPNLEV